MAEEQKHINNVCFHFCHKAGKARCQKCASLHNTKELPATHPNDTYNPDLPVEGGE